MNKNLLPTHGLGVEIRQVRTSGWCFSGREICRVLSSSQGFSNHPSRLRISTPQLLDNPKKKQHIYTREHQTNFEAENSPLFLSKGNNICQNQTFTDIGCSKKNRIVCVGGRFQKKRSLNVDFLPPRNGRFCQPPRLPFHLRFRPERSTPNNRQRTTPTVFHGWFGLWQLNEGWWEEIRGFSQHP